MDIVRRMRRGLVSWQRVVSPSGRRLASQLTRSDAQQCPLFRFPSLCFPAMPRGFFFFFAFRVREKHTDQPAGSFVWPTCLFEKRSRESRLIPLLAKFAPAVGTLARHVLPDDCMLCACRIDAVSRLHMLICRSSDKKANGCRPWRPVFHLPSGPRNKL